MDPLPDILKPENAKPDKKTTSDTTGPSAMIPKQQPPKTAFISYSVLDRIQAFLLKRLLEQNGIKPWLDVFDIRTTGKIQSDLFDIIGKQDLFCLLLSPKAVESRWVRQEIETARSSPNLRILPIILRPCDIPLELEDTIGFDAREGLERDSVQHRLLQAVRGEVAGEGSVLLNTAERELQLDQSLQNQAEESLPQLKQTIDALSTVPFRKVTLEFYVETLPEDPEIILELRLTLDTLGFGGHMSFFIARYREGRTWPVGFDFPEPDYDTYSFQIQPRLDVQFKWFDRIVQLRSVIDNMGLAKHRSSFFIHFDGNTFTPRERFALPQVFEVPNLDSLVKNRSEFQLISHNTSTKLDTVVPNGTDIAIKLIGQREKECVCLYRSHTTRYERNLLNTNLLSSPGMNLILRDVLLDRFLQTSGENGAYSSDMVETTIDGAIEKDEYKSDEVRRLAAYRLYGQGLLGFGRGVRREAYASFEKASLLLWPLVSCGKVPLMRDATSLYMSVQYMVRVWLQQKHFEHAEEIAASLIRAATVIQKADPKEPDFQRMRADAEWMYAQINAQLDKKELAFTGLVERVKVLHELYIELNTKTRKIAWLQAIADSINFIDEQRLPADEEVTQSWKDVLRAEIGNDELYEDIIRRPPPDELPVWAKDCTLETWPTKPIQSAALHYSMRIPQWWSTIKKVRGTTFELEHLYRGASTCDAEWLIICFIEDPVHYGGMMGMCKGVSAMRALTGFPVLCDLENRPNMVEDSFQPLGSVPSLAARLEAEEVTAFTCLGSYNAPKEMIGRTYILLIRKGQLAWRISLSFLSECPQGVPERLLASKDHARAGAMLGTLRVGDP
jgi:hypothetical protein